MAIVTIIVVVCSGLLSLIAAVYHGVKASIIDKMYNCYEDIQKDSKKAETFGIIFLVLVFVADMIRISMKPIL